MLSKELYIMDRNTERLMVDELQDELISLLSEKASLLTEQASLLTEQASLLKALKEKEALIAKLQSKQN